MRDGFKVIDADAHLQEPDDLWSEYVEPEFYDRRPRVKEYVGKTFFRYEEGNELFPKEPEAATAPGGVAPGSTTSALFSSPRFVRDQETKYGHAWEATWSPESRLKDMDSYGWDKQVMITGAGSVINRVGKSDVDPALVMALARAYNNWAGDFASTDPSRLKVVVTLPTADVEQQIIETRRCVERFNAVTINMPSPKGESMWHDEHHQALWETCVELDLPVSLHGTNGVGPDVRRRYGHLKGSFVALTHVLGNTLEDMMSLAHFIFTGILEKHPDLRISCLEGNAGWVPFWVSRMDDHVVGRQSVFDDESILPLKPSDYFFRQCFVAADGDEGALNFATQWTKGERIVWNTDYPHPDAPDPDKALADLLAQPISDSDKRKILWDNPVQLYGNRILT